MSEFIFWGKFERDDDELDRVFADAPRTGETGLIAAAAHGDLVTVAALIANGRGCRRPQLPGVLIVHIDDLAGSIRNGIV